MEHRDVRVTAGRSRDTELAAVDPANPVLDVELDQAAFGHLLYRTADQSTFIGLTSYLRDFRNGQPECAGVLCRGVDACVEGAAVGGLISHRLDVGIGRKMDRERTIGRLVFLPVVCHGRASEDHGKEECTQTHVSLLLNVSMPGTLRIPGVEGQQERHCLVDHGRFGSALRRGSHATGSPGRQDLSMWPEW